MKYKILFSTVLILSIFSCAISERKDAGISNEGHIEHIERQYSVLHDNIKEHKDSKKPFPRTTEDGEVVMIGPYDWTSGFYPGALWYIFDLSNNDKWKERAIAYTEKLDTIQFWRDNHDVGFMIECSYGNALKYIESDAYEKVIVQTAQSLSTRFDPDTQALQSWEENEKWDFPVIVDNMMNLELLFHATKISGDSTYYDIAVRHANTTIKNHYREDGSSFHVVDYDPLTGEINEKVTHQGLSDRSAWARGQAWGLYGFTMSFRETRDNKYLDQAMMIAEFIMNHPNMPKDFVPYWDFDAPSGQNTPRDASASAITASALYELQSFVPEKSRAKYLGWANDIVESLQTKYLAEEGNNGGFLLKHSVGSKPHDSEVDVPLNYADYYYLEALLRKREIDK